jgi:hypothetical protein
MWDFLVNAGYVLLCVFGALIAYSVITTSVEFNKFKPYILRYTDNNFVSLYRTIEKQQEIIEKLTTDLSDLKYDIKNKGMNFIEQERLNNLEYTVENMQLSQERH